MPQAVTPSPLLSPPVVGVTLWCVNTTVGSEAEARRLAELLLQQRLAACVQIEALQSHYRWQGALMCEPEWRLSCKTCPARAGLARRTARGPSL
jgi:periplasmic divalent cation tolerance protein